MTLHGDPRVQAAIASGHEPDPAVVLAPASGDRDPVDRHSAALRSKNARGDAEQRGLARAVAAADVGGGAGRQLEVHVAQDRALVLSPAPVAPDPSQRYERRPRGRDGLRRPGAVARDERKNRRGVLCGPRCPRVGCGCFHPQSNGFAHLVLLIARRPQPCRAAPRATRYMATARAARRGPVRSVRFLAKAFVDLARCCTL